MANNTNIYQPATEGDTVQYGKSTATYNAAQIAAANVVVKAGPGRLCKVLVTTALANSTAVAIYDRATAASGTIVGYIASNQAVGSLLDFEMPCQNGITIGIAANLTGAVITISYI